MTFVSEAEASAGGSTGRRGSSSTLGTADGEEPRATAGVPLPAVVPPRGAVMPRAGEDPPASAVMPALTVLP